MREAVACKCGECGLSTLLSWKVCEVNDARSDAASDKKRYKCCWRPTAMVGECRFC